MASPPSTTDPRVTKRRRSTSPDRKDHDIDSALSPRQARSPYATSGLRGSPSIDPIASPSSRPHSLAAPRPAPYSYAGLGQTSSRPYTASSARNDDAPSPSASHYYRSRSPSQYHAQAASSAPSAQSSAKTARALAALDASHLSDLQSDLASITSPQQRASAKMDAPGSARADDASDPSSTPTVKKEQGGTPGEKPRGGQACLECRLAKVRCLPSDDSEDCQRCQRFNFECLFVQHKRGRKPKSKLQGRDLTLLAEAAYATNASPVPERPSARKSVSASNSTRAVASSSAASPGVRWSSAPDSAFPAPPYSGEQELGNTYNSMDVDDDSRRAASPSAAFFSRKQPLSAFTSQTDTRAALDPKNLFGVDVNRMTQAMQQAMRSLERRRGAPYTLVTNSEISNGNDDDVNSDVGATPPPPGATTAADTNAVNESFELVAEQPLTLRVMLKPFEVSDRPDCETPGVLADDRNPLAAQATQPQLHDPITEDILTEPAARALFDLFMHHCNAWSGVFDPSLHTHDFVRKRSPFLYTVLLYVGSRYSKKPAAHHLIVREQRDEHVPESAWDRAYPSPHTDRTPAAANAYARDIRHRIHELARNHAARAFVEGDRTVLCCQAFFILASFKPLDDGLSVIQVGYAFRLAMDIQLHAEMPNCVKPNSSNLDSAGLKRYEAVQRRFRNRQRTFLMLFVQDKSQQISNKITTHSISSDNVLIRRCQTWWKHDGSVPTDAFVCASADMRRIQGKYVELYDRIEALTSATSDGPSIMMPAFLSDLYEWSARWHEALGLREDMDEDADTPEAYERRFQRLCLQLWKNNIKTYISSLVLKSSLKQAALQEHQEIVRNHHRRSTTREKEDGGSVSGKSGLSSGLEPGMVNLMAMPAFWPCVEGARGCLEVVCALPPERLLSAPDATIASTTHAAVLLCSLATVKSQPPLGPGYLRSNIQLIDQASAAFRRASISEDDTVLHIAIYLESLLRPKNAAATHAAQSRTDTGPKGAGEATDSVPAGGQSSLFNGAAAASNPVPVNGGTQDPSLNGFAQFTNFTLLANSADPFYSGNPSAASNPATQPRWPAANAATDNAGMFANFDREGLDAIASAAAAATQSGEGTAGAMDWSMGGGNATAAPWNSLMFGGNGSGESYQQNGGAGVFQGQPQTGAQREQADETLRMLLRFLDG